METGNKGPVVGQGGIIRELIDIGFIPRRCTSFELIIKPNEPVRYRAEVLVTVEQLEQLRDALENHPEAAAGIARSIAFREPVSGESAEVNL